MVVAAVSNSGEILLFLYCLSNSHRIWWESCESVIERTISSTNAHLLKLEMAATALLNIEKLLLFLHFWKPKLMAILKIHYRTQLSRRKRTFTQVQPPPSWISKMFAIPLLFDQFSPNLVGILQLRQLRFRKHLCSWKWAKGSHLKMAAAAILSFEKMWLFQYY